MIHGKECYGTGMPNLILSWRGSPRKAGEGAAHSSKLPICDRSFVRGVYDVAGLGLIQRGGTPTGFCVIVLGTGGAARGSRYPRLLTGRPYGTGLVWLAGFLGSGWRSKLPLVRLSEGALSVIVMCPWVFNVRDWFGSFPSLACGVADAESVPLER